MCQLWGGVLQSTAIICIFHARTCISSIVPLLQRLDAHQWKSSLKNELIQFLFLKKPNIFMYILGSAIYMQSHADATYFFRELNPSLTTHPIQTALHTMVLSNACDRQGYDDDGNWGAGWGISHCVDIRFLVGRERVGIQTMICGSKLGNQITSLLTMLDVSYFQGTKKRNEFPAKQVLHTNIFSLKAILPSVY